MSLCHEPACPAWGVQNLPLSYPTAPPPLSPTSLPPLLSPPLSKHLFPLYPVPAFAPSPACNSLFFRELQALVGRRLRMMPAGQECSEGCWGRATCPVSASQVYPTALNLLNTPNIPWRAAPCQESLGHHCGHGLSSSPEVSQVGFMRLLCRKHVLKRNRLAEAEDGASPSG